MKKLILLSVITLILIVGTVIAVSFLNQKTVQFNLDGSDYSVQVINESDEVVKTLTSSAGVRINEGVYSYQVIGDGLDSTPVEFIVNDSLTVNVVSKLTSEKLLEMQEQEAVLIRDTLLDLYLGKADFALDTITLYEKGDWASAILSVNIPQQAPNTYRTVLHKENGNWKVKIPPTIAINKNNYKDVPESVFDNLYKF